MDKYQNKYRSQSLRLQYWDYSNAGYYFITICTKDRQYYFGEIQNSKMFLNTIGNIAQKFWLEIPNHFSNVILNEFIIMPNHVHGIVVINDAPISVASRHCLDATDMGAADIANQINTTAERINIAAASGKNIGKNRFQNQGKNTISSIIGSYKSICTKTINKMQNKIYFAWQPGFYEHIIRHIEALDRIRHYIINNPANWNPDKNN